MSIANIPVYRTEEGVHNNPAVNFNVNTNCNDGDASLKKTFKEVFIHWSGAAWVIDDVYDPTALNTRVALRVDNPCSGDFALINYPINDFRILGLCCGLDCPIPITQQSFQPPTAFVDQEYVYTRQLLGEGPFSMDIIDKPDWMTINLNTSTGLITLGGTPVIGDLGDDAPVTIQVNNCGAPFEDGVTVNNLVDVEQTVAFVTRDSAALTMITVAHNGSNRYVAGSANGGNQSVQSSPDGIVWTLRTLLNSRTTAAIAYGNSVWVALGVAAGPLGRSQRSIDNGATWADDATLGAGFVSPKAAAFGLGNFVAVGSVSGVGQRAIFSDDDGGSWQFGSGLTDTTWNDVIFGINPTSGDPEFIAVSDSGRIATSPDGVTWTMSGVLSLLSFSGIVNTGTEYLMTSDNLSNKIFRSVDGIIWTQITVPNNSYTTIAHGEGITVIAGLTAAHYSLDLVEWKPCILPAGVQIVKMIYGGAQFVGVSNSGPRIITSPGY